MAVHLYFATVEPRILATGIGHLMRGIGKKRMIPVMLKNRWHNAIWTDAIKLFCP